jgi:hypothetical protein
MRSVCQRLYFGAPFHGSAAAADTTTITATRRHVKPFRRSFLSHSGNNIFVGIIAGFQPVTKPL